MKTQSLIILLQLASLIMISACSTPLDPKPKSKQIYRSVDSVTQLAYSIYLREFKQIDDRLQGYTKNAPPNLAGGLKEMEDLESKLADLHLSDRELAAFESNEEEKLTSIKKIGGKYIRELKTLLTTDKTVSASLKITLLEFHLITDELQTVRYLAEFAEKSYQSDPHPFYIKTMNENRIKAQEYAQQATIIRDKLKDHVAKLNEGWSKSREEYILQFASTK